ncbi:MAG TPA: YibE/F family protein [Microthrixaceae bacterium]|nr:YibE/F family protein [Microthrixaceae bacterium]
MPTSEHTVDPGREPDHGHSHGHAHSHGGPLTEDPRTTRPLNIIVIVCTIGVVLGLVAWWPSGKVADLTPANARFTDVDATVTAVRRDECPGFQVQALTDCQIASVALTSGTHSGETVTVTVLVTDEIVPTLARDDHVVLAYNPTAIEGFEYTFVDFQRSGALIALAVLFVIVIVAVGRRQGIRALLALGLSLAALMGYMVPSLLRGHPALGVAAVGTTLVAMAAMYLTNGINAQTTVAFVGTLGSLLVTAVLAVAFVRLAAITGLADDADQFLKVTASRVDLRGLVIAGTVIGALGVLDDVTVTQVSAVAELRRANPTLGRRELYVRARRIGRDHIASTVNTLVLAYAGASLPLLLTFYQSTRSAWRVVTSEVVATEIVRTLTGSIGLALAVPVTTGLAAALAGRRQDGGPHDHDPPAAWDDFAPTA